MVRGLEDPTVSGLARLEGLESQPVLGVGRCHIGPLQPAGIRGHVGLDLEGQAAHVVHEQRHAFLGQRGSEGVHGFERGIELHQPVELLGRLGDARILGRLFQGDRRDGMGRLPLEQWPGHGIEPEQHR